MISYFSRLRDIALEILFPAVCLGCGSTLDAQDAGQALCRSCGETVVVSTALTCPVCRGRVPTLSRSCHPKADYILAAASRYEIDAVRSLIWHLKFHRRTVAAPALSAIAARYLASLGIDLSGFLLIPIPLHQAKLRERGFNQAELIAGELTKAVPAQLAVGVLRKVHATKAQSTIKEWEKRAENLAGSFSVVNPEAVRGRDIVLLDDVWTSGATMNEAARMLKEAGARKIIALVIAKAG